MTASALEMEYRLDERIRKVKKAIRALKKLKVRKASRILKKLS